MYKEIINNIKPELEQVFEYLKEELNKLRVGRATPAMVEDLKIKCYGEEFSLKQLANISTPQPRVIVIQPWDRSILEEISKGISASSAGLAPIVDGGLIRINLPSLSEERRIELTKIIKEKTEEARISVRIKRDDAWKEIQEREKTGEIREDDKFRGKDELQKTIDGYNEKIEDLKNKKEEEIMTL